MIYGVIMAGGKGSRMGNTDMPKQFLPLRGRPVIIHTLEKFMANENIDAVIIMCPEEWIRYTEELLRDHPCTGAKPVRIAAGGDTRSGTLLRAIDCIEENFGLGEDTALVTHDAARPFVTQRIIDENVKAVLSGNACTTAVPATDTLAETCDGQTISRVPDRSCYWQVQTPQSFPALRFRELYDTLAEEEKSKVTDAAGVFTARGGKVILVRGETYNIKITYPMDIRIAEAIAEELSEEMNR